MVKLVYLIRSRFSLAKIPNVSQIVISTQYLEKLKKLYSYLTKLNGKC